MLVFGGSRGPRPTALGPLRWGRCVGVPTVLSGFPFAVCRRTSKQTYEIYQKGLVLVIFGLTLGVSHFKKGVRFTKSTVLTLYSVRFCRGEWVS